MLKTAISRVFEGKSEPVILLRTTFGGGKTHTLIAMLDEVPDYIDKLHLRRKDKATAIILQLPFLSVIDHF